MKGDYSTMPIRTIQEINLTDEERSAAVKELRTPGIGGFALLHGLNDQVSKCYQFSQYLVDPCRLRWDKSVRAMAYVFRFLTKLLPRLKLSFPEPEDTSLTVVKSRLDNFQLSQSEISRAENYFFKKATEEVKVFAKQKDWKETTTLKDGILYYNGRVLDSITPVSLEHVTLDLEPLQFVRPIVHRYSPVGYSIVLYCHEVTTKHMGTSTTLRESRNIAFILNGRDLAKEVREKCTTCRRHYAKRLEVEMGKVHRNRLCIAPAFYNTQIDLFGPYEASCEHNHRSKVKIWGAVFKCPSTGALAVHCVQGYSTAPFLGAYTRFSARYGHPAKIFIDEGSQLVQAFKKGEFSLIDLTRALNFQYQVGLDFTTGPPGGHHYQGCAERSIKSVKRVFNIVFSGLRLDIMSYETCFAYIANELNNLPICLSSRTDSLDMADLISPSRLLLGRNNRRALGAPAKIAGPSRLMDQIEKVEQAWWNAWNVEKLVDYIPQPSSWKKTIQDIKVGDIVMFLKADKECSFGEPRWKMGRVLAINLSSDGVVRTLEIQYKNANEDKFSTTRRYAGKVAVLHSEDKLELLDQLRQAGNAADAELLLSYFNQLEGSPLQSNIVKA